MPRAFPLATGIGALLFALVIPFLHGEPFTVTPSVSILFFLGLMSLQQVARMRQTRPAAPAALGETVLLAVAAILQVVAALLLPALAAVLALASAVLACIAVGLQFRNPTPSHRPRAHRASPRRTQSAPVPSHGRETGTVKWFNTSKGFGFICRDTGEDIFVHFRAIRGEGHRVLAEGQRVEFSVTHREKGLQAEDVVALA